ncbi:OprD family outer membrane porin [Mixta tenebrionis]|uniref:OprD family porin n=1 Tax=Mixta tenebrionis TaxID=2562439 RepID=A0A506V582_9GAMM|nr:OprD family outer membrane porin [Mixta tenebrionis]TPW40845.1 OprD family porin [Mixta tenebrionis]
MKKKKIAILSASLLPLFCAAESGDNRFIDRVAALPLLSESSLDVSLRNHWKYLKEDAANPKTVHAAWGQGLTLDYKSGYLADVIGFDASWYGAAKLGASDHFGSRGILYKSGSENKKSNAHGFNKFGQRYVKLKYGSDDFQLKAQGGWQRLKEQGVISTSLRLSPVTYRGWSGDMTLGDFSLLGAWVDRSLYRDSPRQSVLKTNDGRPIDHLASGELRYKSESFSARYALGESDGYLRRQHIFLSMPLTSNFTLGSQLYFTRALEEYRAMAPGKRDFDRSARHYALDLTWQQEKWRSKWGLGYTEAAKKDSIGFYPRHMSKQSFGTFISMASAGEDYLHDKELMIATMTDYRLNKDLLAGIAANAGRINYNGRPIATAEINLYGQWTPSHPSLKNLRVWAMFGPGWSYKNIKRKPVMHNGDYSHSHFLAGEVIIDYKFKMF